MRLDVMDVDAAQYAQMSWEMLSSNHLLQLYCSNHDYLDKPPLLFWLNSLSFYLLGISNFSYKLPSILFALIGIYSTYRFTLIYYSQRVAQTAAIMLATSQALFLITNDVRTDTILMGAVMWSVWQWTEFFETSKTRNLYWGSLGLSLALLAKGPVAIIATGAALMPQLLWKQKLNKLFDSRIILAFIIIALLLIPMCVGLYNQFGVRGLKFYFWTQSFGRITGENEWNNHPDTFFLVHSMAWAFLPWSVFLFIGWMRSIGNLLKTRFSQVLNTEIASISGFSLMLLALSLSQYQLPHYIFVVFPLAAVIASVYYHELPLDAKLGKYMYALQGILIIALLPGALFCQYAFMGFDLLSLSFLVIAVLLTCVVFLKTKNWIYTSGFAIVCFNILLSGFYYPEILKYQPQADFGKYMRQHSDENISYIAYKSTIAFSTVFYAQQMQAAEFWKPEDLKKYLDKKQKLFVITGPEGLSSIRAEKIPLEIIQERISFPISRLNGKFLNPTTRQTVCEKLFLLKISL
ncbi:MAG: glycosyltransferase family 39 protein [Chitinophagales bacterium]